MAKQSINPSKLATFLVLIFGAGLLQLWILAIFLGFEGNLTDEVARLWGNGGLYFFSTSLVYSSFLTLLKDRPVQYGSMDMPVSFVSLGLTTLIACIAFVRTLDVGSGAQALGPLPFASNLFSQLTCVAVASSYAFFVGISCSRVRRLRDSRWMQSNNTSIILLSSLRLVSFSMQCSSLVGRILVGISLLH